MDRTGRVIMPASSNYWHRGATAFSSRFDASDRRSAVASGDISYAARCRATATIPVAPSFVNVAA
jgi:hypothetical protein